MPVKRKPATTKRRKKRATAATPATRKKTTKRRKKTATAARATTVRRRRKTKATAKTAVKRPRRKTTVKRRKTTTGHKRKTAVRRKPRRKIAVKKKPSKSKVTKGTPKSSRVGADRKPRAVKKTRGASPTAVRVLGTSPKKKQRRAAKSDSQVRPVVKQQPSLEVKMAESKKLKKQTEKQVPLPETMQESASASTEPDASIVPYEEQPGEDYMNSEQLAHFRRLLLQRKHMLLEDMGRTVHHLQDEGAALPDISDRATQEEEFNLELRARDRERKLIKKIEATLQRLGERGYGFCTACGAKIGLRRLEARPTATLCFDCKTLDEIREKQMGG